MTFLLILLILIFGGVAALALWTWYLGKDATKIVPQAGTILPVNGGNLHFVESGPKDAPTLVMIHGLSGQLQQFTYALTEPLSQDFRVIAVDRPGCGYSDRASDEQAELETQGRMIWELLDQLDVKNPVLVGHSLGGAVSLAMALERPDQTAGLALLCPLTHPETEPSGAFSGLAVSSAFMRRLIGYTLAVPMAKKTATQVLNIVFGPEPFPQDFLDRGGAVLGLRPKAFITASADFVLADTSIRRLSARYETDLQTPGGVLFGADDMILSPDRHGVSMTRFGFTYEDLPNRGHMIPLTDPESCETFIRTVAERAATNAKAEKASQ